MNLKRSLDYHEGSRDSRVALTARIRHGNISDIKGMEIYADLHSICPDVELSIDKTKRNLSLIAFVSNPQALVQAFSGDYAIVPNTLTINPVYFCQTSQPTQTQEAGR